jgi:hypothetical protein
MLAMTRAMFIVGTSFMLAWLVNALYRDVALAALAALVYITLANVFLYRGWLACADTPFALFAFAAMTSRMVPAFFVAICYACKRRSSAPDAAGLRTDLYLACQGSARESRR